MIIYTATTEKFKSFKDGPAWFSLNLVDAEGWQNGSCFEGSFTYVCEYTGGKIAGLTEVAKIAKEVWPEDDLIYSMHDTNVGEFDEEDIRKFHIKLTENGYDGAYIIDYHPRNHNEDSITMVVFHPNKYVKIVGTLNLQFNTES